MNCNLAYDNKSITKVVESIYLFIIFIIHDVKYLKGSI